MKIRQRIEAATQAVRRARLHWLPTPFEKAVMQSGGTWFPGDQVGRPRPGLVIWRQDLVDACADRGPDHYAHHSDAYRSDVEAARDWGAELDASRR